jgi:hypothetical protein
MLASISDYLQVWEAYELFPTILVCLAAWLLGGGYLFQKILGPRTQRRKYPLSRGVLISLLSGMGGGISFIALYFIANAIAPNESDPYSLPINWFGVIVGAIGYFISAGLVVISMHKIPIVEIIKGSVLPLLLPVLIGILILGSSFYLFSYTRVQVVRKQNLQKYDTYLAMDKIYKALNSKKFQTGRVATSLEELVTENYLQPEDLRSPANPKGRGFFYNGNSTTTDSSSRELLLCDYKENFKGQGRIVLYCNGFPEFLTEIGFQTCLEKPENRSFAAALEMAERK